jgi:hypothetical protein
MAATKIKKQNLGQAAGNNTGGFRGSLPSFSDDADKPTPSGPIGYVFTLILFVLVFALMLPLVSLLYFDTLTVKREAKQQMEKVEKLRKQVEENAKRELKPE